MADCKSKRVGKVFSTFFLCLGILIFLAYPIITIIFNKGKLPTSAWWAGSVITSKILAALLIGGFAYLVSNGKERARMLEFKKEMLEKTIDKVSDSASQIKSVVMDGHSGNITVSTTPTIIHPGITNNLPRS